MIHVYKYLSMHRMPVLRVSKNVLWIEEDTEDADKIRTLVELPRPVDPSKPVDAVIDEESWMMLTYTYIDEDINMASA